jgi:cobalt-zinc-cadmium efflux system outer membrane protein
MRQNRMMSIAASLLLLTLNTSPPAWADTATRPLSLQESLVLWQANGYELTLGRLQVDSAHFDEISADQRPNPVMSIQSVQPTTYPQPNSNDTTIGMSQLFERGNKRELRTQVAQKNTRATEQDLSDLQRAQGLMVSQAYYGLKLAQEIVEIDRRMTKLYRDSFAAAEKRLKEGDIAMNDLIQLRIEVARIENQSAQDNNALRQAQLGLAYFFGKNYATTAQALMASDPWPTKVDIVATPEADTLAQRPDVRAAKERLEAARSALELARAQTSADVTVEVTAENHGVVGNTVGLSLSMPLMLNYQYQGEIGKAQNDILQAQTKLEQTNFQAMQEIAQAQNDVTTARERLQRFEAGLLVDAERAALNAEFAFRHGESSVLELLSARRTYLATQTEAATAQSDYAQALAAWRAARAL